MPVSTRHLLYANEIKITDRIGIAIPTVGEVLDNEDEYYGMVGGLTAMPIDLMVQLDDAGIDFTKITPYELFLMTFAGLRGKDTKLIFGSLDLSLFEPAISDDEKDIVLVDKSNAIVIDKMVYEMIASALREIHHLEKNNRRPGNEEAKKYMLERARKKAKRKKKGAEDSQLESLIIAMVNAEQYKYDFEGTRKLSIYQFNESVRQVVKKVDFTSRMYGVYAGTVDTKKLSQDDLNWLNHK